MNRRVIRLNAAGAALGFLLLTANGMAAEAADAQQVVRTAATALGMVRTNAFNMRLLNTLEYAGHGTMHELAPGKPPVVYKVNRFVQGLSYALPALRVEMDLERNGARESRVEVVNGDRAWNEERPGVNPVDTTTDPRLRRAVLWMTPHGALRAAIEAPPGNVSAATRDGKTVLTIAHDGLNITVTLNADQRPERVQIPIDHPRLGKTELSATYADYRADRLGTSAPWRFKYFLGGVETLDVTVTQFESNPYVVFPKPELLRGQSTGKDGPVAKTE